MTKAREFIRDLTHHGWRGAVAELDLPATRPTPPATPATREQALAAARAEVAASKLGPNLATADDVIEGRARYADTPGGHADRAALQEVTGP